MLRTEEADDGFALSSDVAIFSTCEQVPSLCCADVAQVLMAGQLSQQMCSCSNWQLILPWSAPMHNG